MLINLTPSAIGPRFQHFMTGSWTVGIRKAVPAVDAGCAPGPFTKIRNPRGRFYADPFIAAEGPRQFLFVEDYSYIQGMGGISVLELDAEGRTMRSQRVLSQPYHLSYPFVFKHQDAHYLLPESSANGTVELYRAVEFPWRWAHDSTLFRGIRAVDSTLQFHNGRWWLFTCTSGDGSRQFDRLELFYSDSPLGPFLAHTQNPVVQSSRTARPAGRLIERDGRLLRPCQDCTDWYGRLVRIMEVDALSPERYHEREVCTIAPAWTPDIVGVHTYGATESFEVVDGLTFGFAPLHLGRRAIGACVRALRYAHLAGAAVLLQAGAAQGAIT